MVPSYKGTPCFLAWLAGLTQSLVPLAKPIKFATPMGALSGKSSHFILPTVVSITAVGPVGRGGVGATDLVAGAVGLAAGRVGLVAGAACDQDSMEVRHRIPTKVKALCIDIF